MPSAEPIIAGLSIGGSGVGALLLPGLPELEVCVIAKDTGVGTLLLKSWLDGVDSSRATTSGKGCCAPILACGEVSDAS